MSVRRTSNVLLIHLLISYTVSFVSRSTEIPNFFTDEECEMIIDLAQEKGLKDSPFTPDTDNIDHKDSIDGILKAWDRNEDGFVDKDEVRFHPRYNFTLVVVFFFARHWVVMVLIQVSLVFNK